MRELAATPKKTMRFTGYKKDRPDSRDLRLSLELSKRMPESLDLSMTGCLNFQLDQKSTSSCVAHAVAEGVKLLECRDAEKDLLNPSRLFIYYNARKERGWETEDAGCYIRDALKVAARYGVADEKVWPFKIRGWFGGTGNINKRPSQEAYSDAAKRQTPFAYRRVDQNAEDLKAALCEGFPILIGLTTHSGWDKKPVEKTGLIPFPTSDDSVDGGHAVLIVGYDDKAQLFKFKNSWGASWGASGYGFAPYKYVTSPSLASDLWALTDC